MPPRALLALYGGQCVVGLQYVRKQVICHKIQNPSRELPLLYVPQLMYTLLYICDIYIQVVYYITQVAVGDQFNNYTKPARVVNTRRHKKSIKVLNIT